MRSPSLILQLTICFLVNLSSARETVSAQQPGKSLETLRAALISDLADSSLERFTLLEAGLIASGVADSSELQKYLALNEALFKPLDGEAWVRRNEARTGKKLLQWLHKTAFRKYTFEETDLRKTLSDGEFNCVTATILFAAACQRYNLKACFIETPIHVFCKFFSPDRARVVETVYAEGFDFPDARQIFQETALATKYITEKDLQTQGIAKLYAKFVEDYREISTARLTQLIFFNQMTHLLQQARYNDALALAQEVDSLFTSDKKFRINYEVIIAKIANQELQQKNSERALALLLPALQKKQEFSEPTRLTALAAVDLINRALSAGKYARAVSVFEQIEPYSAVTQVLTINKIQILSRWALHLEQTGKIDSALVINQRALTIDSNHVDLKAERARLRGYQVEQLVRQGEFEKAFETCNDILRSSPGLVKLQELRTNVIGAWAHSNYERGQWENCIAILARGRVFEPRNERLTGLMAMTYHRYAMELIRQERYLKALATVKRGLQNCPDNYELRDDQRLLENRLEEIRKSGRQPKG